MTISISTTAIKDIVTQITPQQREGIKHLVMFVGHAHSGHSIIGAIMDAHPDVCITNEVNIPKLLLDHQLSEVELESLLLHYSQRNEQNGGWHNTEYGYQIADGHQGLTTHPVVIGDKKGGASTRIIMKNPQILDKILNMYGDKIKVINVHRNPLDVIAAYAYYWQQPIGKQHVERFIENNEANLLIKSQIPQGQWLDVQQAEFINNPIKIIGQIFDFIGVEFTELQLSNWTRIVKADIKGRSNQIEIPAELLETLNNYQKKRGEP